MACESCGDKPKKCNKDFTRAVVEIDNTEQITLMRRVVIPTSMGDDTTVPPVVGKYKNVLLFYEANSKSYLYSSDGIPTLLANGLTDYEEAVNLPEINGHTLIGDKTGPELGLQNEIHNIEEYARVFDTVADMVASTDLADGGYARTLGYYTIDDNGGAYYKISNATPSGYYETLTSGLYAELIVELVMNVKQFGAKGDGVTDDTAKIQTAFDTCNNIFIPTGTYMIDGSTPLIPKNGGKITLDNTAALKVITNNLQTYRVIHVIDRSDVEISGGTIEGDKFTHTGTTGEWGAGIRVYGNSTNVYIHDIMIKNTWGDGITIATTGNVRTERVHIDNARRNGYSVVRANEFVSTDDIIENTSGTNPQAGVDIEPDNASHKLINVAFNNLITKNNAGNGVAVYLLSYDNTSKPVNIAINNHYDYGSKSGFSVAKSIYTKGLITYSNAYLESSVDTAIRMWHCYDSDLAVKIIRPYIVNCDTSEQGALYGPGIAGYLLESDTLDAPLGNIEIIEPYITTAYAAQTTAITIRNNIAGAQLQANNVKIIDPIYLQDKRIYIGANNTNVYFSDNYGVAKFTSNSDYTVPNSQYYSVYSNREDTTGNKTLTIPDTMTPGRKMKFMNMNSSYSLSVKLPTTDYCYQLSNTVSPTVTLAKFGDTIELEKVTSTEWIISSINCTPTVS